MPGCGSGAVVSSSSLPSRSHPGRCQAETPLIAPVQIPRASSDGAANLAPTAAAVGLALDRGAEPLVAGHQAVQVADAQLEQAAGGERDHRRAARPAFEQRQLAEERAGPEL